MNKIVTLALSSLILAGCSLYPYAKPYSGHYGSGAHAPSHASTAVLDPNLKPLSFYLNHHDNSIAGQEAALRRAVHGSDVAITREGNTLLLRFPRHAMFAFGSSKVNASFLPILDNIARVLVHYPPSALEIHGHTDSIGAVAYNVDLSKRRAASVKSALQARHIPQGIVTRGLGENQPIADNGTSKGRAQNRRVEIKIVPR